MWNYLLNNSFKLFVNLNCRKLVCFWFDKTTPPSHTGELTGEMLPSLAPTSLHGAPCRFGSFSSGAASQKGAKPAFLAPSPNSWPCCFLMFCQYRGKRLFHKSYLESLLPERLFIFSAISSALTEVLPLFPQPLPCWSPSALEATATPSLVTLLSLVDPILLPRIIVWGGFWDPWGPDTGLSWM